MNEAKATGHNRLFDADVQQQAVDKRVTCRMSHSALSLRAGQLRR